MREHQKNNTRLGWTQKEQNLLRSLYQIQGIKSWIVISAYINQTLQGTKRSPKQCRERYNNFAKLNNSNEDLVEWTEEQNQKLFDIYLEKGSKWVQISKSISGRSQNFLKNRFYGTLRKTLNMINRLSSQSTKKLKPIKYLTLTKILERKQTTTDTSQYKTAATNEKVGFCQKLKQDIIQVARRTELITQQQAEDIIDRAHKFNILTRFQNMARNRSLKGNKKKTASGKYCKRASISSEYQLQNLQILEQQTQSKVDDHKQTNFFMAKRKSQQFQKYMLQLPQQIIERQHTFPNQINLQEDLCMILKTQYNPNDFNFLMPL